MTDTWLKAINNGNLVECIWVDFRKAFDPVDHHLQLQKMLHYRLSELPLSWFDSYLSNRTQQVNINVNISENDKVRYAVPQRSILGPLLFLIFINDLSLTLKTVIRSVDLYADDTTLYDIQLNKAQIENNLQHALVLLRTRCLENGMLLKIYIT